MKEFSLLHESIELAGVLMGQVESAMEEDR